MLVEKKINSLYTDFFLWTGSWIRFVAGPYDIIKAHGEIKVETKEAHPDEPFGRGEGGVFIIQLPTR